MLENMTTAPEQPDHPGEEWHPNAPLVTLHTAHRSIAQPIVKYLSRIEAEERYHQLVVLIPEVQPPRFWDYVLFNQRGTILDRAIRRGTANVVLCRLRYRLEQLAPAGSGAPASGTAWSSDAARLSLIDRGLGPAAAQPSSSCDQ